MPAKAKTSSKWISRKDMEYSLAFLSGSVGIVLAAQAATLLTSLLLPGFMARPLASGAENQLITLLNGLSIALALVGYVAILVGIKWWWNHQHRLAQRRDLSITALVAALVGSLFITTTFLGMITAPEVLDMPLSVLATVLPGLIYVASWWVGNRYGR
jgi:hypothetical protein